MHARIRRQSAAAASLRFASMKHQCSPRPRAQTSWRWMRRLPASCSATRDRAASSSCVSSEGCRRKKPRKFWVYPHEPSSATGPSRVPGCIKNLARVPPPLSGWHRFLFATTYFTTMAVVEQGAKFCARWAGIWLAAARAAASGQPRHYSGGQRSSPRDRDSGSRGVGPPRQRSCPC